MLAIPARGCSAPASPATRSRRTKATSRARASPEFSAAESRRCPAIIIPTRSSTWTSCGRRTRWQKCSRSVRWPTRPAPRCRNRRSAHRKSARRWWSFLGGSPVRSDLSFSLLLALAQIIVGGAYLRTLRRAERIEILLRHDVDAAVCAHLDDVEPFLGILEHPVFAFELGGHALDRTLDAERLAAFDIDLDRAERRALRQHDDVGRHGRRRMQFAQGMPHDVTLEAGGGKSRGLGRAIYRRDGAQVFVQRIGIVGVDGDNARHRADR